MQEEIKEPPQTSGKQNKGPAWEMVKSKKSMKKERKKQPPEKPPVLIPKPKQRKPRRSATLSKGSGDRGKTLHNTIVAILQEDAKVINTGPEEDLEIRDLDDTTTTGDIRATSQKAAGNDCGIIAEAIKIRKAFRGTQTASVTLAAQQRRRCAKAKWTEPNSVLSVEKRDTRLPSAISQQNVHYVLNNPALRILPILPDEVNNGSAGFVAVSVDGICFYTCYAPPSLSITECTDFLDKLTEDAKKHYPVAIAGDFNSWAVDWGNSNPIIGGCAKEMTEDLMKRVTQACEACMPRKRSVNQRPLAIKDSKRRCWEELISEVDKDPWGRPYKVVMTHLKIQPMPSPTCPQLLQNIVTALFPQRRILRYPSVQ
ncbi:hypothetical protein EVAR_24533_1 [Eumeta japonica]|uniref:Uncharacterized protein n=1 Tax=Eumeta variegata TaxID=151549 RepID=A0A4C1US61_EUMVA|nr:hypothetical protein EVAR_24533_1 [Eumeta japonica]